MKNNYWILTIAFVFSAVAVMAQSSGTSSFQDQSSFEAVKLDLKNQIEIYPNPSVKDLFVEIKNSNLDKVEFEMHSIIGTRIRVISEEISKDKYRISVKDLNAGYYFLVITDESARFNQAFKFLKRN